MLGLWHYHRAYRQATGQPLMQSICEIEKSISDSNEKQAAIRIVQNMATLRGRISPSDAIGAALFRLMRRKGLKSVASWNELVDTHTAFGGCGSGSIRNALYIPRSDGRPKAPIRFCGFIGRNATRATPKYCFPPAVVSERLERLRAAHSYRIERTCYRCGRFSKKVGSASVCIRYDCVPPPNEYRTTEDYDKALLCVSCWNRTKPIFNAMWEANEIRLLNNRLTRTISERKKTQDNRTSPSVSM